jgi:acyl-CoA thioesterase FadM
VADWIETYRGVVNAWECDVVEHFTVAYYFDRLADTGRNLFDALGAELPVGFPLARKRLHVTFQKEFRAGAGFHIESAVIGCDAQSLRLGHCFRSSANGEPTTWGHETIAWPASLSAAARRRIEAAVVAYPGPAIPDAPKAGAGGGMLAVRERVKAWEIDEAQVLSLPGHVHRFSAAMMQTLVQIGMDDAYMQGQRRGFSTFELDFASTADVKAGEMLDVRTSILNLGKSSLRFLHVMTGRDGRPVATMGQSGVHLDLDARRSTPLPDALRVKAEKLLVS